MRQNRIGLAFWAILIGLVLVSSCSQDSGIDRPSGIEAEPAHDSKMMTNNDVRNTHESDGMGFWPRAAKRSYVDRCASSMAGQGLPEEHAVNFCSCMADGMEQEFGSKDYDQMMKAQPDPVGSSYDQRLYEVLTSCSHLLPR